MESDSDRSDSLCTEPLSPFKNDQELEKERTFIPEILKFSIENILRPDFGCKIKQERLSPRPEYSSLCSSDDQSKASSNLGNWPPAWVFCTRYSDRPSAGPRSRRPKRRSERKPEDKRPRTAFTQEQLDRLKKEFHENRYLTEKRRQDLAKDLQLNESQIKIWNKRAKLKKSSGCRNSLALSLLSHGLYNQHGQQDDQEVDQYS